MKLFKLIALCFFTLSLAQAKTYQVCQVVLAPATNDTDNNGAFFTDERENKAFFLKLYGPQDTTATCSRQELEHKELAFLKVEMRDYSAQGLLLEFIQRDFEDWSFFSNYHNRKLDSLMGHYFGSVIGANIGIVGNEWLSVYQMTSSEYVSVITNPRSVNRPALNINSSVANLGFSLEVGFVNFDLKIKTTNEELQEAILLDHDVVLQKRYGKGLAQRH